MDRATRRARFSLSEEQISLIQERISGPAPFCRGWRVSKGGSGDWGFFFEGAEGDETYTQLAQPVDYFAAIDVGV